MSTFRRDRDSGVTLVELLVSMVITGIFLAMFASAMLSLVRAVQRQTSSVNAQQMTRDAFLSMDKQVRYADAVTSPGFTSPNSQWIEWRVPDPSIPVSQSPSQSRCFQWMASSATGTLQYRTWLVPAAGVSVATPSWRTMVTGLIPGSVPVFTTTQAGLRAAPFLLPIPLPSSGLTYPIGYAQVGVVLNISTGTPAGRSSSQTVFTALNSSSATSSACTEVPRA